MHHLDVVVFSSTLIWCSMISTNATVGVALLCTGTSIISHALIASATVAFQPTVALLLGSASCAVSTTFLWHCCVISTAVLHKCQQGQGNSCQDEGCLEHFCNKFVLLWDDSRGKLLEKLMPSFWWHGLLFQKMCLFIGCKSDKRLK